MESFAESSAQWPLLNIPGAFLRDWMPLIDEYHYCEYGHLYPLLCAHIRIQIRPRSVVGFTSLYTFVNPCREFCRCPVPICAFVYGYLQYPHCSRPDNPPDALIMYHCVSRADLSREIIPISTPMGEQFTLMLSNSWVASS